MYCIHCGTPLPDVAKFCFACGQPIQHNEQTNTESSTRQPQSHSTLSPARTDHPVSSDIRRTDPITVEQMQPPDTSPKQSATAKLAPPSDSMRNPVSHTEQVVTPGISMLSDRHRAPTGSEIILSLIAFLFLVLNDVHMLFAIVFLLFLGYVTLRVPT
jgi:hypothetical protein